MEWLGTAKVRNRGAERVRKAELSLTSRVVLGISQIGPHGLTDVQTVLGKDQRTPLATVAKSARCMVSQ